MNHQPEFPSSVQPPLAQFWVNTKIVAYSLFCQKIPYLKDVPMPSRPSSPENQRSVDTNETLTSFAVNWNYLSRWGGSIFWSAIEAQKHIASFFAILFSLYSTLCFFFSLDVLVQISVRRFFLATLEVQAYNRLILPPNSGFPIILSLRCKNTFCIFLPSEPKRYLFIFSPSGVNSG